MTLFNSTSDQAKTSHKNVETPSAQQDELLAKRENLRMAQKQMTQMQNVVLKKQPTSS